ncbi:MAG TPA: glycine zipper 2TM domain-containing protein [Steroidobacteraceae bacterium]|nr:glycine zipper 2TM domain-containing protein [Steroidobacteraceae bacterium]
MNKSMLTGVILGVAVATAGGAFAGYKLLDRGPSYAQVLDVKPIMETVKTPREVCHDETVTHTREAKDQHKIAGTALGAVVGGVLGNQIGGGSGKTVATVAGAAAGGYAGNRIQNRMQQGNTYQTTERRCETVYDSHEKQVGYNVKYRLDDTENTVQMDHHPGERIPVKDGQLVLTPQAAAATES